MKSKLMLFAVLLCFAVPRYVRAQATSRVIPFSNISTTIAPSTPAQPLTIQLWDAATAGTLQFSEAQTLDVNEVGSISFNFGSSTAGGLDPTAFPSGSSRYLDVADSTGASVLPNPPGRIPLNATAFSLSPGPQGPTGPAGAQGPQGAPGVVQSVAPAADNSVLIGGTAANPTIAVAANGVTNNNVANGALNPAKITGTAATLGANNFAGNQTVNGTVSATGVVSAGTQFNLGAQRVLGFQNSNVFAGLEAGSQTTGFQNVFVGPNAGNGNTTGNYNAFIGTNAGLLNTTGGSNTFLGTFAGFNSTGSSNTMIGSGADVPPSSLLNNATAIGAQAHVSASNSLVLGGTGANAVNVGIGTPAPGYKLHVIDPGNTGLRVQTDTAGGSVASFGSNGQFLVDSAGVPGGRFYIGENGRVGIGHNTPPNLLSLQRGGGPAIADGWTTWSSARFKTNIRPLVGAIAKIEKLRGVSYNLKATGKHDIGLIAEEVAQVVPEVVSLDPTTGEVQGLDYARLTALLIEAVKQQQRTAKQQQKISAQQQAQIQKLQSELKHLQTRLDSVKGTNR